MKVIRYIVGVCAVAAGYFYLSDMRRVTIADNGGIMTQGTSSPNRIAANNEPIIFEAIMQGDLKAVESLLSAGADKDIRGFGGDTPALRAAVVETWHICMLLLESGADPAVANRSGLTIPYLAMDSRVDPSSLEGHARQAVLDFLQERGLEGLALPPTEVRRLQAENSWPPDRQVD